MKRSGLPISVQLMYVNRQKERIESVLNYLSTYSQGDGLKEWNFHTISIYCFLDWALFREIISLEHRPECRTFLETHKTKQILIQTQIPKV